MRLRRVSWLESPKTLGNVECCIVDYSDYQVQHTLAFRKKPRHRLQISNPEVVLACRCRLIVRYSKVL